MILEGAGVCPLVKIGDEVNGFEVIDIICDRLIAATCRANRTLARLRLDDPHKDWHVVSPTEVETVDCKNCPVLAEDPDHFDKTKWLEELMIATGKPRSSLVTSEKMPKDIEPEPLENKEPKDNDVTSPEHKGNRFDLIEVSEEED